mmetsp:Transcript_16086/g.24481  ORF Transcript_16086/g.24481 Transcript_16086/m.24481 type:complete len:451 (+) Transcript_16086:693-2045(+)
MASYEVPHPCCRSNKLTSGSLFNKVEIGIEPFSCNAVALDIVQIGSNKGDKTRIVFSFSCHDFSHCHFLVRIFLNAARSPWGCLSLDAHTVLVNIDISIRTSAILSFSICCLEKHRRIVTTKPVISLFQGSQVPTEKELSFCGCISAVSSLHVCINSAQRDIQIQVKGQDDTSDKDSENSKSCILKVGQLHLHTSKLRSPSDMRVIWVVSWRRRLPAHRIPVCALNVFKVFSLNFIINFLHSSIEYNKWIPNKQMGDMLGQGWVNSSFAKLLVAFFINWHRKIIVHVQNTILHPHVQRVGNLFSRQSTLVNVSTDTVISTLVNSSLTLTSQRWIWWCSIRMSSFRRGSTIYTFADHPPAGIGISNTSSNERSRGCECHHYWSQNCQLVVHKTTFLDIFCLKSYLQTTTTHTKCHSIHVNCSPNILAAVGWLGILGSGSRFLQRKVVFHKR